MEQGIERTIYNNEINNDIDAVTRDISKMSDDEKIDYVAERILNKYRKAFEALAK